MAKHASKIPLNYKRIVHKSSACIPIYRESDPRVTHKARPDPRVTHKARPDPRVINL